MYLCLAQAAVIKPVTLSPPTESSVSVYCGGVAIAVCSALLGFIALHDVVTIYRFVTTGKRAGRKQRKQQPRHCQHISTSHKSRCNNRRVF